jgi:oligopeptide/dipeptide ABC transporter ATP-binding protein
LEVRDLHTQFPTDDGLVRAVDGVSFDVFEGETLGIVGESGCGKSVTSLSVMNMISSPGTIESGRITFRLEDQDPWLITDLKPTGKEMQSIRGNHISMIFQEPMTSFTPVYSIGRQVQEQILQHRRITKNEAKERSIELLEFVGIANPRQRYDEYPHQFSGGMRQRAMIAMALSCDPRLLIADEPTTALDVTIEAQILDLLRSIQERTGMAVMLITHDMSVIAQMSDRVMVMYMGKSVEEGTCEDIFYSDTLHPYTEGLLTSIPTIGVREELSPIRGNTPSVYNIPAGCPFHPRCPYVMDHCSERFPEMYPVGDAHTARCFLYEKEPAHAQ